MFYLNRETELTTELLSKMINKFRVDVEPRLQKYKNYYDGKQAILQKSYKDPTKPCNKTVMNYCKTITDGYSGYTAAAGCISYSSTEDITDIMEIMRYNDYQAEDSAFMSDLLLYGTAAELMYIDSESKVRFKLISPLQCFAVFDDSLTNDLLYFVRMYKADEWDESNTYIVDVHSDTALKRYEMQGESGLPIFKAELPLYFSQCPANVAYMPDERSVFDCILTQQDAINELVSAEIDDYSAFCDAYLVLEGVDADADDIAQMKENRVLLLPEGAKAYYATKNSNAAHIESIRKNLHESIYRTAQSPDFSSESFVGGVSSGIAIQYRLTGMETRAATICAPFKKALQRRIEIIAGVKSLLLGEEVYRDIKINFKRNIPADEAQVITVVNGLKGTVSDKTLLGQVPFVEDVEAELEALQEQKSANMALYNFGASPTATDTENGEESEE
jgi:SPP1 family phage portal protein